jgi:amino acid transporter
MTDQQPAGPRRRFSSFYVATLAIAMVIGAGIFQSPAYVASNVDGAFWLFGVWILGGVISLIGALTYAELASAFPGPGGEYNFLRLAYGRGVAFLFAWARFAVVNTGSLALLGFVLGNYLNSVPWLNLGPQGAAIYAGLSVLILTFYNLRSAKAGAGTDYGMTFLEVMGLIMMGVAALWLVITATPPLSPQPIGSMSPPEGLAMAMVFVLLAFGGWNEAATLSSEVKDAQRGMVRALVMAVAGITILYLIANWALWRGLGLEALANSKAPAAELMGHAFGPTAHAALALAVAAAVITSINATILVGARTTFACATDWSVLKGLAQWDRAREAPVTAIWAQGAMGLALVVLGASFEGFKTLVEYTSPIYWLFFTLCGLALFVLRAKFKDVARPFKVPLYPVLPLIFCAASAYLLYSSVSYVWSLNAEGIGVLTSLGVLIVGALVLLFLFGLERRRQAAESRLGGP